MVDCRSIAVSELLWLLVLVLQDSISIRTKLKIITVYWGPKMCLAL